MMIVIASYADRSLAHIDRLRLEGEGIPSQLQDEHMGGDGVYYGAAVGGVKLCVAESDRERAIEIIYPDLKRERLLCPGCGSNRIRPRSFRAWMKTLFFGPPLRPGSVEFVCRACAHEWVSE